MVNDFLDRLNHSFIIEISSLNKEVSFIFEEICYFCGIFNYNLK
jgi:hypothetical protein